MNSPVSHLPSTPVNRSPTTFKCVVVIPLNPDVPLAQYYYDTSQNVTYPYVTFTYDTTPFVIPRCFYVPLRFIPEIAGVFKKRPFPVRFVPVPFIPKGKGCIFKLVFPDFFCEEKIRIT